jgi:hypothetical protein
VEECGPLVADAPTPSTLVGLKMLWICYMYEWHKNGYTINLSLNTYKAEHIFKKKKTLTEHKNHQRA